MDIWWSLHLRREPASVPLARRVLLGTMAAAGVDPDVSYEVGVALSEACANAVEHASPCRAGLDSGADQGFQVTAAIIGDRLHIEVSDSGPGFAVRLRHGARGRRAKAATSVRKSVAPDLCAESGRGMFLIRALSDSVQFRNHPRSGAVVSFDRTLTYRDHGERRGRPLAHAS
ncbi:ATP-binding protein [Streptacidiphilus jiangxiensis]|uniref:Serine/threonine-protein kinase RsbW n=1 Tax=Streptacidiphilus jiangxiensis TaxID=235985 RepID=A0A1H7J270_STRJI|nr:ATP-binding protein [Streptacidiphilus jiangxiensis]SEK68748.1 serine/threonine-protein kinase RsbW [Streptacidiphilus jiangxiensis]